MSNDGGPAFPQVTAVTQSGKIKTSNGMSLRDYFAAEALNAMVNSVPQMRTDITINQHDIARACYQYADAMLLAREPKL